MIPALLMVLAAAEHCRLADQTAPGGEIRPVHRLVRRPVWLPLAALAVGFSLLAVAAVRSNAYPWWGLVVGAVTTTFAVAARQVLMLRENQALVVTDSLTGLASRVALREALRRANERRGQLLAVLHIDLDDFKQVNDAYGHDTGDAYLTAFADVLRRNVRTGDTAARLGGDEFAIVLDGVNQSDDAVAVAKRILTDATQLTDVDGHQLRIRASIGIAVAVASALEDAQLLRRSDQAMYAAKRRGSHSWRLYAEGTLEDDFDSMRRLLLDGCQSNQMRLEYQPIVSLTTGEFVAVEALVRWQHPTRGLLAPLEFIPLAEETGAIDEIGQWVVEEASRQVAEWRRQRSTGPLSLAVNVSARQIASDTLAADIIAILARHGLPPRDFVAEVTEVGLVEEGTAIDQLEALRRSGARIALDDFGTGYSSLRYLTRLPVDILKLDRSFVAELNGSPEGSAVAQSVILLAQILHLDTVAEGIERPAQAAELAQLGYHQAQGYLFSPPLSADDFTNTFISTPGGETPSEVPS